MAERHSNTAVGRQREQAPGAVITHVRTAIALFALLILTVLAAQWPLGRFALVVALAIAGAKATLVALYFMHVRSAVAVTRIFAIAGVAWLGLLIAGTVLDVISRSWFAGP